MQFGLSGSEWTEPTARANNTISNTDAKQIFAIKYLNKQYKKMSWPQHIDIKSLRNYLLL